MIYINDVRAICYRIERLLYINVDIDAGRASIDKSRTSHCIEDVNERYWFEALELLKIFPAQ